MDEMREKFRILLSNILRQEVRIRELEKKLGVPDFDTSKEESSNQEYKALIHTLGVSSRSNVRAEAMGMLPDIVGGAFPKQVNPEYIPSQKYATSVFTIKNEKQEIEDRYVIHPDLNALLDFKVSPHQSYYAVFDDHSGNEAASFAAPRLHVNIGKHPAFFTDTSKAIIEGFLTTHLDLINMCNLRNLKCACSVVCAFIREDTVFLSWLGDSQALLVRRMVPLTITKPHKPDREDEKKRIESLGGQITFKEPWCVNSSRAIITRAIGYSDHKRFRTSRPDIAVLKLDGTEDFLILASHGLFDTLTPEEMTSILYRHLAELNEPLERSFESFAAELVHQSKASGSEENITAIVIFLRDLRDVQENAILFLSNQRNSDFKMGLQKEATEKELATETAVHSTTVEESNKCELNKKTDSCDDADSLKSEKNDFILADMHSKCKKNRTSIDEIEKRMFEANSLRQSMSFIGIKDTLSSKGADIDSDFQNNSFSLAEIQSNCEENEERIHAIENSFCESSEASILVRPIPLFTTLSADKAKSVASLDKNKTVPSAGKSKILLPTFKTKDRVSKVKTNFFKTTSSSKVTTENTGSGGAISTVKEKTSDSSKKTTTVTKLPRTTTLLRGNLSAKPAGGTGVGRNAESNKRAAKARGNTLSENTSTFPSKASAISTSRAPLQKYVAGGKQVGSTSRKSDLKNTVNKQTVIKKTTTRKRSEFSSPLVSRIVTSVIRKSSVTTVPGVSAKREVNKRNLPKAPGPESMLKSTGSKTLPVASTSII